MRTTKLRRVRDNVVLDPPPEVLEALRLEAGARVDLSVEGGRLIVEPRRRPRYQLEDLLAKCNPDAPLSEEDREWLDSPRGGRELI